MAGSSTLVIAAAVAVSTTARRRTARRQKQSRRQRAKPLISRSSDSIWVMARRQTGRGSDPNPPLPYAQEMARRQRAWELRRENNELLDKQWAEPHPEPEPDTDMAQLLDREYARHQRRNRSWAGMVMDPDPVDTSLPRHEWDERVRSFLRSPTRPTGSIIARDPHALVGEDAVKGVRSGLIKALGPDGITNKGVADRIKDHLRNAEI